MSFDWGLSHGSELLEIWHAGVQSLVGYYWGRENYYAIDLASQVGAWFGAFHLTDHIFDTVRVLGSKRVINPCCGRSSGDCSRSGGT